MPIDLDFDTQISTAELRQDRLSSEAYNLLLTGSSTI
jgi:hypothetical protein